MIQESKCNILGWIWKKKIKVNFWDQKWYLWLTTSSILKALIYWKKWFFKNWISTKFINKVSYFIPLPFDKFFETGLFSHQTTIGTMPWVWRGRTGQCRLSSERWGQYPPKPGGEADGRGWYCPQSRRTKTALAGASEPDSRYWHCY